MVYSQLNLEVLDGYIILFCLVEIEIKLNSNSIIRLEVLYLVLFMTNVHVGFVCLLINECSTKSNGSLCGCGFCLLLRFFDYLQASWLSLLTIAHHWESLRLSTMLCWRRLEFITIMEVSLRSNHCVILNFS